MKTNKITKLLFIISIVAIVFDLARLDLWGKSSLSYLIWNLFLAWIPYIISFYFIKKEMLTKFFIPFFILWILFFPNAPYLITDVLHVFSSSPSYLWYDSLLFFFFGWIGLLLGVLSLFHIHQYLKVHFDYLTSELMIFFICIISSFGIYLGRFERWNSWDAFISPLRLIKSSFYISANLSHEGTPLIFVIVFTVFLYLIYKTVDVLLSETKNII